MRKLLFTLTILLTIQLTSFAQDDMQGIKDPGDQYLKKCKTCIEWLKTAPREVQFGFYRDDMNNLNFYMTNLDWFKKMFTSSTDGIAIDLVSKSRYSCISKRPMKEFPRGEVLKPVYQKEMLNRMMVDDYGNVIVPIAKLPEKYKSREIEYNAIFIKNKYICHYHHAINVNASKWGLIDLGFYMDTLTYPSKKDSVVTERERYITEHQTKKFEIRFEKNKSTYSKEDLQSVYESLSLNNYDIKNIKIRAYSSVEGTYENNIRLQEARSSSIIEALQGFQDIEIKRDINAVENWVEFLKDISGTEFNYLSSLSKDDIKVKLQDKKLCDKLEPILSEHRKAVVILEIQKKNRYRDMKIDVLIDLFNENVKDKNIAEANQIQHSLAEKLRYESLPSSYLDKLEIPEQADFGLLMKNRTMYKYLLNEDELYDAYLELLSLEDILPKDGQVKYNICALKFKLWLLGTQTIDPQKFYKEISALVNYGIDYSLVKRMQINYHIIMSEINMLKGDYIAKDKSVQFIKKNYTSAKLPETDLLSLANYFSAYAKYDWAVKLIEKEANQIDATEDLVFYYLSLTLNSNDLIKKSNYRSIMLNAINMNQERFCSIFNSYENGGSTFQLLENKYLRKTYCENCRK